MQRIFKIFLYPYRQSHPDFCKAMEALFKADCAGQSGIIGRLGALFRMIYDIVRTKPNQGRIPRFGLVLSSCIIRTFPVWGGWVIAIAAIALLMELVPHASCARDCTSTTSVCNL